MIFINTIATYMILQDQIAGLLVSGNIHTLIEMISLFYIVNCPATMLIYFTCDRDSNIRRELQEEDGDNMVGHPACAKLFIATVALITILQNAICCIVFYYVYSS